MCPTRIASIIDRSLFSGPIFLLIRCFAAHDCDGDEIQINFETLE